MPKRTQRMPCYRVCRGAAGMWDVYAEGVPAAVASFHEHEEAAAYAQRLAARMHGEVVVEASRPPRAA